MAEVLAYCSMKPMAHSVKVMVHSGQHVSMDMGQVGTDERRAVCSRWALTSGEQCAASGP